MPGPAWIGLSAFLFADAATVQPNLFLGVVLGVLVARLRWSPRWRRE